MRIKFKNLKNNNIKIENPIDFFGLDMFIEICNEWKLMLHECVTNAQKLAAYCIINNSHFEYVECVFKTHVDGKDVFHPHAISYWDGHYFDFTLALGYAYNMLQDKIKLITPDDECIPVRRFEFSEIKKFIDYSVKHDVKIFMSYMENMYHISQNGKISQPTDDGCKNWKHSAIYGMDVYNIECSKLEKYVA